MNIFMVKTARNYLIQNNVLALFAALVIFFSITNGQVFLANQNLLNILRQIAIDIPPALGLTFVLIASGGVDLSVGSVLAMSASLTMGFQPQGVVASVAIALAFGIIVGIVNGLLISRGKVVPFIATLGTMTLVHGMMLTYTRQQPIAGHDESFTYWGAGSVGVVPTPFVIAMVMLCLSYIVLKYTQFGRNCYATGGNSEATYLAGVDVDKTQFVAYVISGCFAAISGVLVASRLNSATIHLGADTPLWSIAAAIMGGASMLGGKGSVLGTFIGVLSLGILLNGSNLWGVQTYLQIGIKALILIGVVVADAFSTTNVRKRLEAQVYGNRTNMF